MCIRIIKWGVMHIIIKADNYFFETVPPEVFFHEGPAGGTTRHFEIQGINLSLIVLCYGGN